MHDYIKKFQLRGQMEESGFVETKQNLVKTLCDMMREEGFVPALDIDPQFTVDYRAEFGHFEFRLTIYGAYVGRDDAWRVDGVIAGKTILKSSTPAK